METKYECDDPFFIQNALFKCEDRGHISEYVQMEDLSKMMVAIANNLASIENYSFDGGAQERKQFLKNMQKTLSNKWVDLILFCFFERINCKNLKKWFSINFI